MPSGKSSFDLIYSCHSGGTTTAGTTMYKCPFTGIECDSLKELFYKSSHPFMRSVVDCLPDDKKLDVDLLNRLIRDDRYACFIVAEGRVGNDGERTPAHQTGYVLTKRNSHLVASHRTHQPTLFSHHTLRLLQDEKNFVIEKLHHVLVTGASTGFQPLFGMICNARMRQTANGLSAESALLKFFACTFIGLSQSYNKTRNYVTVRNGDKGLSLPAKRSTYVYSPIWGTRWVQVTRSSAQAKPRSLCQAVGMGAVFYAKARLLRSLLFIERTCAADAFRILNINTDSITLALAENTLRECVAEGKLDCFDREAHNFIRQPPEPGYLKLESSICEEETEWLVHYHGAKTEKITLGKDAVEEKKKTEDTSFPLSLTPYRHVYCSYDAAANNERILYWTVPFGTDDDANV